MGIALAASDKVRTTKIFNDLAAGGIIKGALTEQPSGSSDGWRTDKLGIAWNVSLV